MYAHPRLHACISPSYLIISCRTIARLDVFLSFPSTNDDDIPNSPASEGKRMPPVRCALLEFANYKESSHAAADALKNVSGSLYRLKLFCAEFSPPAGGTGRKHSDCIFLPFSFYLYLVGCLNIDFIFPSTHTHPSYPPHILSRLLTSSCILFFSSFVHKLLHL